jgi:phosphate transport system permease protein
MEEYAPKNRLTNFIDVNIRNLAGVPSIVYGILGFTIFVEALGGITGGRSVIAAGLTLSVLVLPIVIITSAEAIRAVPDGLREAGYGVGATRWEVVRTQILPYAAPGILTGTVLSLARALGEAAPLILVGAVTNRLGSNPPILDVSSLQERFTAMPSVITSWAGMPQEGFRANTAAAIIVLLVVVLIANAAAVLLRNKYEKKR